MTDSNAEISKADVLRAVYPVAREGSWCSSVQEILYARLGVRMASSSGCDCCPIWDAEALEAALADPANAGSVPRADVLELAQREIELAAEDEDPDHRDRVVAILAALKVELWPAA